MPDVSLIFVAKEGDWAAFRSPFGARIVYHMEGGRAFDIKSEHKGPGGRDRWKELDELSFGNSVNVTVSSDIRISELKRFAIKAAQGSGLVRSNNAKPNALPGWLPSFGERSIQTWLENVDGERFPEDVTVDAAGLDDGDVITLCIEHESNADYHLGPVSDPQSLFRSLELGSQSPSALGLPRLWGILLYTDSDIEIAKYVREQFDDLNALSGPLLRVFVLERPDNWRSAKRYWRGNLEPSLYRVFGSLQWLKWKPYEQYRAYDIARELDIDPGLLPCLVLLRNPGGTSRISFPIPSPPVPYLRRLFGEIAKTLEISPSQYSVRSAARESSNYTRITHAELKGLAQESAEADRLAFDQVAEAERRIKEALEPAHPGDSLKTVGKTYVFNGNTTVLSEGTAMSDSFHFYGQTTFINRPVDTVIQDFQNKYHSSPAQEELSRLLTLVLSSKDIGRNAKEETAVIIHELAADLNTGQHDQVQTRTRLEALRDRLSRVADVAAPALEIIGAILGLLGHH